MSEEKTTGVPEWACVGFNPTTWALGIVETSTGGRIIRYPKAMITRLSDGSWTWRVSSKPMPAGSGWEPSREEAMAAAEKALS